MFEIVGDINKMILGSFEPSIDAQDPYSDLESIVSKVSSISSDGETKDKDVAFGQPLARRGSNTSTIKDGFRRALHSIDDKMHDKMHDPAFHL